jgi:hypothetical protein
MEKNGDNGDGRRCGKWQYGDGRWWGS